MKNISINNLNRGRSIHDKYIGEKICKALASLVALFAYKPALADARNIERLLAKGRSQHDKHIGIALQSGYKQLIAPRNQRPMPHRILAP